MADLFSILTRLAERQGSVLAARGLDETAKRREIRKALESGVSLDCWSDEETSALIENLLKPVVRRRIGRSPWGSVDEGVSALLEGLRCYLTWHGNLALAARPDTISPAGALFRGMGRWLELYSSDLARKHWKEQGRSSPIESGRSDGSGDDPGGEREIPLPVHDSSVNRSDLATLADTLICRINGGAPAPVRPPEDETAMPGRLTRLFLECRLWLNHPMDPKRRPASVARFAKWTQEAWAGWRGIPNSSAGELSQKLVASKNQEGARGYGDTKGILQEFFACPYEGAEPLTLDEAFALGLFLQERYFAWKPEFVLMHSLLPKN